MTYMCMHDDCHRSVKTPGYCYWHEPEPTTLAAVREALPGVEVSDDSYSFGYWACHAGLLLPFKVDSGFIEGWNDRTREMAAERDE